MTQEAEQLPSKCEALSFTLSTSKKKVIRETEAIFHCVGTGNKGQKVMFAAAIPHYIFSHQYCGYKGNCCNMVVEAS
jgi:hypothetical protein